jgi:hypothetical protein
MFHFDTLYDELEDADEPEPAKNDLNTPEERAEHRAARKQRLASSDMVIVPARQEGFQDVFIGKNQWHAISIGAAMKDRIKYIAAYQVAPTAAVTQLQELRRSNHTRILENISLLLTDQPKKLSTFRLKTGRSRREDRFMFREKICSLRLH